MIHDDRYYKWLISFIRSKKYPVDEFEKLLCQLFDTDFYYIHPMDENRAIDGLELREEYSYTKHRDLLYFEDRPCSILEMMIALAICIERDIMVDEYEEDKTPDWFWEMVESLGLSDCSDYNYDECYVTDVLERFVTKTYLPNGRGGLFYIDDTIMVRDKEIWYQAQTYLNYIIERSF